MKSSVKKFFLLGLGLAVAGAAVTIAVKNKKIRTAVSDLVKRKKLTKDEGAALVKELGTELVKAESKVKTAVKKTAKKVARKL